jgi:hypothetical protein
VPDDHQKNDPAPEGGNPRSPSDAREARESDPDTQSFESIGVDVPEADRLEQERDWVDEATDPPPRIQLEDSEADVLEQHRDAGLDDDEWKAEP